MQIAFLLLYVFPGIFGIEFYPFRSHAGDRSVSKNDDGSSPDIPIVTQFPFFNHQHDHLIVNTNGVISFLKTVSTYTPNPFPLDGDRRLVAIFWADVDTRKGGTVWYRESTNQTILERATNEVRTYFPQFFRFQATWVFIATWDNVAFYGCSPCTKRNTFQEILITNGQHSFTVFNYGQIEWTTGKFSGGDERTGLGGTPAQVGFNAGDGKVFFVVDASRTPDIVNVNHMTNIGIPGKFAFRIDAAEIGNGGCNTQGNLLISPRHGPMLGGQYLVISGPCINQDDVIQIQYSPMLTLFHCKRESNYSAICITPIFNITDDITVNVIIRDNKGQEQHHTGLYTIVNPALFKNPVKRHQPQNWNNGQQHVVSWDPHVFELKDSEHVQIHLFTIKEQLHNQLVWEKTVLHEDIPTILGTYTIGLQTDGYMAAIRITAALETDTDSPERGIWSDIFAVVPQRQKSRRFCQYWLRQEFHLSGVSSENIPPCPCTLQQALMDTARYQPDPDCNMVTKTRDGDFNCLYRADAKHCVKLSMPGAEDNDNVCCYDIRGDLIDSRVKEGGSLQRYHYLGGEKNIPYVTNFYYDVLPFLHCCRYYGSSSDVGQRGKVIYSECQDYLQFRKVSSCYNYIPPRPAGANGDPHIKTLDGFGYNFNGLGEFHFIVSRNMPFESQIRFEKAEHSNGNAVNASICTSFVAHVINTTDKVEVILNSIRVADVLINGQIQDFSDVPWLRHDGLLVLNLLKSRNTREILLMFPTIGISFRVLANTKLLNVMPIIANNSLKGTITGLLGDFDGNPSNDLILPNGTVLEPNATEEYIFSSFNNAWRITNAESLFTYPNGKSYMYYNSDSKKNFRPVFLSSIASSSGQEAREVCGNNTDCLFDFYVTGSREIAQATLHFTSELEDALNAAKEVIACPVLQSVNGGSWLSNSTIENATATFYCLENYSMNGTCQPKTCINGTWTNIQMCSCEMSPTTAESTHRTTPVAESSTMPTTTSKGTSTSRATTKTSFSTITRAPTTTLLTTPTLSTSTATRNRAISTSRTISPSKGTKPPPSISPTLTSIVTTTRQTTTSQKFLTSTVSKTVQTTTPQKVLLTTVSKTTQTNTPQKITTTTVSKTARTTTSPNFFTTMVSKTAQTTPQKSLTTTVSKTAQTTHKTPTNPHLPQTSSMHTTAHNRVSLNPKGQNAVKTDDSSVMLKSVYNSIKMMWVSVGGGVIIIIIIVLITSFAICFKMRSKSQCVKGDESTSLSSQSSTGFRKPAGIPPLSRGSLSSETNHAYSDYNEGSRFSLPRYNVHKNSAYGYFDSDCQVVGNPAREQRAYY